MQIYRVSEAFDTIDKDILIKIYSYEISGLVQKAHNKHNIC